MYKLSAILLLSVFVTGCDGGDNNNKGGKEPNPYKGYTSELYGS
jgi:hypothetical protein